ncbi:MAG: general secretion pathway protein GspD [Betaproteobacteria bacterium]|nr:general secretion pathway protein GspD [Betaproteobacteria bacterium]
MKFAFNRKLMAKSFGLVMVLGLTSCSTIYPPRDTSTLNRIEGELKQAAQPAPAATTAPVQLPDAVSSSLLPAPRSTLPRASAKQLEQRFDLVVTNAPISQVLMSLVTDTSFSIMVKPKTAIPSAPGSAGAIPVAAATGLTETVTINLKNVTLFEALDSIREVYGYDYTVDGTRIYVQQPELQTRLYQVDYVIGQRRGVSDLQVIGGASVGSSSSSGSSGSSGGSSSGSGTSTGSFSSVQGSAMSTLVKSDVWAEVEDALRTTLGCSIPNNSAATTTTSTSSGSTTSSGQASRADLSFRGETSTGVRQRGVDGCTDGRAMSVSQMSGTVMVRGMPNEHRMIEKLLRSLQLNIQRQVIIEAKIIDVELNSGAQQGINWANFDHGLHRASVGANPNSITVNQPNSSGSSGSGGIVSSAATLGSALGTALLGNAAGIPTAFTAGLGLAVQFRNFAALINFLETQGEVHVLSSPRISALNSQKAVIKVGTEEPFVSTITPAQSTITNGISQTIPPSLNYQPFFSGIALDVTPKIDDKGDITLHVHAMVNNIQEKNKVSGTTPDAVSVPFAVNTISETDSVVKSKDGQVVVIGGLMTETMVDNRGTMPGVGNVPGVSALFTKGGQRLVKRELVILLRPTIVKDDSVWADDISATQNRVQALGASRNVPGPQPANQ